MAWSNEEISTFQSYNNQMLEGINETLPGLTGKPIVGIFAPGQNGDAITSSSCLKYKDELWPDKDIVWFCNMPVADFLRYNKYVNEVRPWPWAGNGLPIGTPDFWPLLMNENNQLNLKLASQYDLTKDLCAGYFPCPYMLDVSKRHNIDYPNCSRKVFGIPDNYEWHPVINFSDEERQEANDFMKDQMPGRKVIIESFAGSGQSLLDEAMIEKSMALCEERWVDCNFIFASHKFLRNNEKFPAYFFKQAGVYSCANFTVRQCALIAEQCDLMISVSSGITVASSAWGIKQPPTIQYTGSFICSTKSLANGHFELVTYDDKSIEQSKEVFYNTLEKLLIQYK